MKNELLQKAIGRIDDELIEAADMRTVPMKKKLWKWAAAAACLLVFAAAAVPLFSGLDAPGVETESQQGEIALEKSYRYAVNEAPYAEYVMGKTISDDRLGEKLADVTVTAGWVRYLDGEHWEADEHVKAELCEIRGVSAGIAVAIRFLEPLEAERMDCCYVIINPAADTTPVREYVIERQGTAWQSGRENEAVPE